jgi:rhodanese-related sulfurtransferase
MIAALFLSLGLAACSASSASSIPPNAADSLVRAEAKDPRFLLVDVRTPEEFAQGHIAHASLVDFKAPDFSERIGQLPRDGKILIYCRSGHRSGMALSRMKELGFSDVHDVDGGINAWTAAGLPLEK